MYGGDKIFVKVTNLLEVEMDSGAILLVAGVEACSGYHGDVHKNWNKS